MRALSPTVRTATAIAVLIVGTISLLSISGAGAFLGDIYGDGKLNKVTKTTVTNSGGVYSAQGSVNHFATSEMKFGKFTVDVKDKSVTEVNYFGSTFCFIPNTKVGETDPEAATKSFNGTESVAGKTKAEITIRLPKEHFGCDLSIIASVLRPGDGVAQSEIIVKKMVLTASASEKR